ncbi:MAG TPA: hypothetical protein VGL38_00495 [bacterium]|jgi:hypothetical protein
MHRERLNHAFFIGLFLIIAGCGGGPERIILRGGTEHLPLLDDRVMRYRETVGTEEHTYTMHMYYAGGRAIRVYPVVVKGIDLGQCMFRSKGDLVYFGTNNPRTALSALPEYRQLWVDETAKPGEEWEDMDTGTKTLFEGFETVTVPAGTFDNCYKTTTIVLPTFMDSLNAWRERGEFTPEEYNDWSAGANDRVVRWFAPGVGLVKEQINGSDHVRELEEVVKPGTGRVNADTTQTD